MNLVQNPLESEASVPASNPHHLYQQNGLHQTSRVSLSFVNLRTERHLTDILLNFPFRMTSIDSNTYPTWTNATNYGRSYGTEGETNCTARFERKPIPENETVFILKTVDKEELISEIKSNSGSSWSGVLTATIVGNANLIELRKHALSYSSHFSFQFSLLAF